MTTLTLTWQRVVKVWWTMFWRFVFFGFIVGIALSMVTKFIEVSASLSPEGAAIINLLLSTAVTIPLGIYFMKGALEKRYSDFRIIIAPSDNV